jgi:hypothetical protein
MDVGLISPINTNLLKEFSYNPDEINQFSMSRLIGLGLTLLKNKDFGNESFNREFIIRDFSYQEDNKTVLKEDLNGSKNFENNVVNDLMDSLNKLNRENIKIKEKLETKSKSEEKKKELPPLPNLKIKEKVETKSKSEEKKKELPPLPNLKIKEKVETKSKSEEKKKELPPLPDLKKNNTENISKNSVNNEINLGNLEEKTKNKEKKPFKMDKSFLKDD